MSTSLYSVLRRDLNVDLVCLQPHHMPFPGWYEGTITLHLKQRKSSRRGEDIGSWSAWFCHSCLLPSLGHLLGKCPMALWFWRKQVTLPLKKNKFIGVTLITYRFQVWVSTLQDLYIAAVPTTQRQIFSILPDIFYLGFWFFHPLIHQRVTSESLSVLLVNLGNECETDYFGSSMIVIIGQPGNGGFECQSVTRISRIWFLPVGMLAGCTCLQCWTTGWVPGLKFW